MAIRGQELNTRFTATNEASQVFAQVEADAERLEGSLDKLTKEERKIVLEAEASKLEREVDRAYKSLASLRDQESIDIVIDAKDQAQAKLRDVRAEINRLDSEEATVEVDADTSGAIEGIGGIGEALEGLGVPVGNFANMLGGLASPGGAIAAVVGGLLLAADHAADLAVEADNLAALTGDSVEFASRLNAVWKQTGADAKDLQDVMLQMNGVLSTNSELAAQLGINLTDGATIGERFQEVAAALDKIPDAAQRSQLASQLFGEEGVRQYTAMKRAVGDLGTALENVPEGAVFNEEDVEKARQTQAAMAELKVELEALAVALGQTVVPAVAATVGGLNDLFEGAENVGRSIRRFFDSTADENWRIVDEFEAAEEAAKNFDRQLLVGATSFDEVQRRVEAHTGSMHAANVVALEWAETHETGTGVLKSYREVLDMASGALVNYSKLEGESADMQEQSAEAAEKLTEALHRQQQQTEDLKEAKTQLVGGDIAVRDAQRAARDAAAELDETLKTQGLTMDQHQAAVDGAATAQLNAAQAAVDWRIKQAEANGHTVTATEQSLMFKQELERLASQVDGPLREALQRYIDDLNRIPTEVNTRLRVTGATTTASGDTIGQRDGPRHTGGLIAVGGRYRLLAGEEIEFNSPAGGRVFSREDVARSGGGEPIVIVHEYHHQTVNQVSIGVEAVSYSSDEQWIDDLTNRIAFRIVGAL